jgi:hypothetical protein
MDKLQTHPLIGNGAPQEVNCKCLKIFIIEVKEKWVSDGGQITGQTG